MSIIFGINPVVESLKANPANVEGISMKKGQHTGALGKVSGLARKHNIRIAYVDQATLNKLSENGVHQGVVATVSEFEYAEFDDFLETLDRDSRVVVLDSVQDPRNLGAIVRTAVASGAAGVIIPERNAATMTASAIKTSAGAAAHAKVVRVTNLTRTLEKLMEKGLWAVAVEADAEKTIFDLSIKGGYVLVFGSEGKGVRRLVRETCDEAVQIPMKSEISSLNVSVAVGITLYTVFDR
jgi:23S rRNA (guanosine2251-2'-O)-methyltransferase